MNKIRSFIAIPLSEQVRRAVGRLLHQVASDGDGIAWVPADNLHLTLKFLGDVADTEIPSVCSEIRAACDDLDSFALTVNGTRCLPSLKKPRVLCAGIDDADDVLPSLVADLETRMADLGFKREPRDYVAHLTLGRAKGASRRASSDVLQRLQKFADFQGGEIQVDRVQLIASFLDKSGPTYQTMDTVML